MILSGLEIAKQIELGNINIDNFDKTKVGPNSYNLKIHNELMTYTNSPLDMRKLNETILTTIPEDGYLLMPGKLYLARTVERTFTDKYVPMLEGRSSIGRLGMSIHVTAGFGDIGFNGFWTLELHVIEPLIIYPDIPVCQIYFHTIEGDFETYKSNKYQNNSGIQSSQLWKDF